MRRYNRRLLPKGRPPAGSATLTMLSYRHAFHAGNHADVLKHAVFVQLLRHLLQKDKPFWCIDTHAGAALHALDEGYALKNAEFESGISRLWALSTDESGRRRRSAR